MDEIKEKILKHDHAINTLTKNTDRILNELHSLNKNLANIPLIIKDLDILTANFNDSLKRVHARLDELKDVHTKVTDITTKVNNLNITVFGKDGRGGLLFDVEDIKRFMYKAIGLFTVLHMFLASLIGFFFKNL